MSDNELGMILAYIEAAKDEKELQAMTDALEKRKEQLVKEDAAKEARAMAMSMLFEDWQDKAENTLESLFDKFHSYDDSMYIKITAENMAECLVRLGYKVERPHKDEEEDEDEDENSYLGNFYFTLKELKFYEMYRDNVNDVIIPLEL